MDDQNWAVTVWQTCGLVTCNHQTAKHNYFI